jgi:hypothetical protein
MFRKFTFIYPDGKTFRKVVTIDRRRLPSFEVSWFASCEKDLCEDYIPGVTDPEHQCEMVDAAIEAVQDEFPGAIVKIEKVA